MTVLLQQQITVENIPPYSILYKNTDAIIIHPENARWYFTTDKGGRMFAAFIKSRSVHDPDGHYASDQIQAFIRDVEQELAPHHEPTPSARACSVYITEACNMRCRHCRFACATSRSRLDISVIRSYLRAEHSYGAVGVTVTGGEPLLIWPLVEQTLNAAKEFELTPTLLTNGSLVTEEIAKKLSEYRCQVQVSLDSVDPEKYEDFRRFPLKHVLRGIDLLLHANVDISLSCTLTKQTMDGVDDILTYAISRGIRRMHFALLEKGGRAIKDEQLAVGVEELRAFFRSMLHRYFNGLREKIYLEDIEMYIRQIVHPPRLSRCNCAIATSALYEDGAIYGCTNFCGLEAFKIASTVEETADYTKRRLKIHETIPQLSHVPRCRDCCMRWVCVGGCRDRILLANNGDLLHEDPFCELLYEMFINCLFEAAKIMEKEERKKDVDKSI